MRRLILPIVSFATLALAGCTADEAGPASASSPSSASGSATAILNAGVTAEIGDTATAAKFLFDPLYDNHFGSLEQLDAALIEAIVSGEAPYDGVAAVFVSHAHGDHFSARHLNRMLAAQPQLQLVAPQQAIEQMRANEAWDEGFAGRVQGIALENGEQATAFEIAGARIEAFRSPHNGWPERHANVHNLSFRVSAPSGAGLFQRVMHLGDADPSAAQFAAHAEFLGGTRTSLAIVPFWFLNQGSSQSLIGETLNAEAAVGMHVPAREPGWLAGSGWDYFSGVGQQVAVPVVE